MTEIIKINVQTNKIIITKILFIEYKKMFKKNSSFSNYFSTSEMIY